MRACATISESTFQRLAQPTLIRVSRPMIGYLIERRLHRYFELSQIEEVEGERWCQSRCRWCGKPIRFKIPGDGSCSPRCRDKYTRLDAWHNRWFAVMWWCRKAAKVLWLLLIVFNGGLWGLGVSHWLDQFGLELERTGIAVTFGICVGMVVAFRVARRWLWFAEEREIGGAERYEKGLFYPWGAWRHLVGLPQSGQDPSLRVVMRCLRRLPGLHPIRVIRYPMFFKYDLDRVKEDKWAIESVKTWARTRFGGNVKTEDPQGAL